MSVLKVTKIIKAENFDQAELLDFESTLNGTELLYAVDYGNNCYAIYNTLHGERDTELTLQEVREYEE